MKKVLFVLAIAVALTFAMTATAFADHSPTFFVEWQEGVIHDGYGAATFGNPAGSSPHSGYVEGTEKCGVCHSVHRAPVGGVKWDTNPADDASRTAVAGGQYNRAEWEVPVGTTTQMLLANSVANSCNFCHIETSLGGKQLFAGDTTLRTSEWNEGFAHGNACSACHAVHGVNANGIFKGPMEYAVLKAQAKGTTAGIGWQDEVVVGGVAGKAGLATSVIPGMAAWAAGLPTDDARVDTNNVPLFYSEADALAGTNVRPDADAGDAQVAAFCTACHQNYGYGSEYYVNVDHDRSLFQGPWSARYPEVAGTTGDVYSNDAEAKGSVAGDGWAVMRDAEGYGVEFHNHPVKAVDGAFAAAGKSSTVPAVVSFADASTCRSCHDAGVEGVTGVIVQSFPHFTPGYFHFVKPAPYMGAASAYDPPVADYLAFSDTAGIAAAQLWLHDPINYEEAITVNDGECLKCHVNSTNDAGIGKSF